MAEVQISFPAKGKFVTLEQSDLPLHKRRDYFVTYEEA